MAYEQCVEHIVISDSSVMTWVKILFPAVTSIAGIWIVYWLTTRKEKKALIDNKIRSEQQEDFAIEMFENLLLEPIDHLSFNVFREHVSKAVGICDYIELANSNIFTFSESKTFARFTHFKRIVAHYKDALRDLAKEKVVLNSLDGTPGIPRDFKEIKEDIIFRLKEYTTIYGRSTKLSNKDA